MSDTATASAPARLSRVLPWGALTAALVTAALGVLSTLWKAACTGGPLLEHGVTTLGLRAYGSRLCYSDLLVLWQYRELADHAAPYAGAYTADGQITGGVIEYPVLGGLFLWLTGLPADTDGVFIIITGLVLTAAAVAGTLVLYTLVGARAYLWAAAPAIAVYTAYNIDVLPAVATIVAIAVVAWRGLSWGPVPRAYAAAAVLGIGGALKIYPLMFALPIALWAALSVSPTRRLVMRWGALVGVLATAAGVMVLVNLPFALMSWEGWLASFRFQSVRRIDDNSMALWWWVPHLLGFDVSDRTAALTLVAAAATAAALVAATVVGLRITRDEGVFPWLAVSASFLAAFMLLNKVNSPQYIVWLLPFFVLLRVRVRWVLLYFLVDLAIFFAYFRPFALWADGLPTAGLPALLALGILVRAGLLAYFAVAFLRAPPALLEHTPARSALR
jgi:hypothetical protein